MTDSVKDWTVAAMLAILLLGGLLVIMYIVSEI